VVICRSPGTWQGLPTGLCFLKGKEKESEGDRKEGRKKGGTEGAERKSQKEYRRFCPQGGFH
jgi:hypothetical protein